MTTNLDPKVVFPAWVAALRSERYKQGREKLRSADDKFCCFGVLCDLVDPNGWDTFSDGERFWVLPNTKEKWRSVIPDLLEDELGLDVDYDSSENPLTTVKLMTMNDTGKSFDEIADAIEERYIK